MTTRVTHSFSSSHTVGDQHCQGSVVRSVSVGFSRCISAATSFPNCIMEDSVNTISKDSKNRYGQGDVRYDQAVRDLVGQFAAIPEYWIRCVAQECGDDFDGVMWDTMFLVNNSVDQRKIRDLLRPVDDEALGSVHEISTTGIFAWEIDSECVLGINGAGYDFYAEHWSKLYDSLDYRWHESD